MNSEAIIPGHASFTEFAQCRHAEPDQNVATL
jgi:hypothetical protein